MGRKVAGGPGYDSTKLPDQKGKTPNCAKCGSEEFASVARMFAAVAGVLVYCKGCGAVVGWGPKVQQSK